MTSKHILGYSLVALMIAVAACSQVKEQTVVDFVMKDYKAESTPGCKGDSACASFEIQHPDFLGLDSNVRKSINEKVYLILNGSAEQPASLEAMGNDFIADFNSFMKEMPGFDLGWYFRGHVKVLVSSDSLISLQVDTESFTGGAHASYTTNFVNVDPKNGRPFLLDGMLRPGFRDELNRLAEEDLRNQFDGNERDSLGIPELLDGNFKLNENYGFRKEGIVFYFNDYELGSFLEGPIEILIPYERLQGWIK